MSSFISPVRPIDTGVPWGWNPAATFQASFIAAQENQRAQEKMAMEQELYRILLPEKIARTEFNLKELAYASKMMERSYRTQSADLDARYRAATSSGRSGTGSGSNAAGNGVGGTPQSRYGFGAKLTTQAASAPQATVRKVGSGVMPKQSP